MLSYRTAGESHGRALIALVEGMPSGVPVDLDFINNELRRRQGGYGRGGRQKIEVDAVDFLSGVRLGKTIGSPVAMMIPNKDARLDDLTAPIVTISLVLAAVFVPVAFIPGLTGRLYNQFALTIVFSFSRNACVNSSRMDSGPRRTTSHSISISLLCLTSSTEPRPLRSFGRRLQ